VSRSQRKLARKIGVSRRTLESAAGNWEGGDAVGARVAKLKDNAAPLRGRMELSSRLSHVVSVVSVVLPAVNGPAVRAPPVLPPARIGGRRYQAPQHCEGSEKYGKTLDGESHSFSLLVRLAMKSPSPGGALNYARGSKTPQSDEGSGESDMSRTTLQRALGKLVAARAVVLDTGRSGTVLALAWNLVTPVAFNTCARPRTRTSN
jgi:hypothetical protein